MVKNEKSIETKVKPQSFNLDVARKYSAIVYQSLVDSYKKGDTQIDYPLAIPQRKLK